MIVPSDSDPITDEQLDGLTDLALRAFDDAPETFVPFGLPTRATVDRLQAAIDRCLHRLRVRDAARFRERRDRGMYESSDTEIDQAADELGEVA